MKTMTMRERMTAFIKGEPHDRIPFAEYNGTVPVKACWDLLGRENMGLINWARPYDYLTPHCRFETESIEKNGLPGIRPRTGRGEPPGANADKLRSRPAAQWRLA